MALILASCKPASVEEEGKTIVGKVVEKEVEIEEEKELEEKVVHAPGQPKYGGMFTFSLGMRLLGLDEFSQWQTYTHAIRFTNEELVTGDWAKGPAGTGEAGWLMQGTSFWDLCRGALAESWEIPDDRTIIFHIRQGVRFHNKPPVNGRELDANDVVYSLKRIWGPPSGIAVKTLTEEQKPISITAPDKWTVIIECPPGSYEGIFTNSADYTSIVPHEMVEEWGDLEDWRAQCGTGPFEIVDHVDSASTTFVKNPNYWMKDPVHPENTLPYLDGIKMLVIPDASTQMTALRTGKIDYLYGRTREDAQSLLTTNPDLQYSKFLFHLSYQIYMRVDKPELPFYDIRVRHALAMAIDNEAIKDDIYGGEAELLTHPVLPVPEFMDMYIPLEELPESVREQYEYHPDKAKQLLDEAGYPNGFTTTIITDIATADVLSIIKAYWADIGVDLEIRPMEYGVLSSMAFRKTHEELLFLWAGNAGPFLWGQCKKIGGVLNFSMIDDEDCRERAGESAEAYFDFAKRCQLKKEYTPYYLEQCWSIETPTPYLYTMWQPWVGGYHGEYSIGRLNTFNFINYLWVDQDVKEAYIGRR